MKTSEIELLMGQSIHDIIEESLISFNKQIDTDFDSIKHKLGIESKSDKIIPNLNFAYRSGVMAGIVKVLELYQSGDLRDHSNHECDEETYNSQMKYLINSKDLKVGDLITIYQRTEWYHGTVEVKKYEATILSIDKFKRKLHIRVKTLDNTMTISMNPEGERIQRTTMGTWRTYCTK